MRGLGVDRHMFGLYVVAKGMNMDPLPKMFQDKVCKTLKVLLINVAAVSTGHITTHI